ncbi:MAG: AI-2E family transporter [Candidatus Eutrophobiaceae bacterium]
MMLQYLIDWYKRHFSDPQAVVLTMVLISGILIVWLMGEILAPLFCAVIIAYLLEGMVQLLEKRIPRSVSVCIVFLAFLTFMALLTLGLLPLISQQFSQFIEDMPKMVENSQMLLLKMQQKYPQLLSEESVRQITVLLRDEITSFGQTILSISLASIPVLISILIYLILVPLMIFFLLKDKDLLLSIYTNFLPPNRKLVNDVWADMDTQIGNYVRGKFAEIFIIGVSSFILFNFMGLNYAPLLGLLVGLSVLIPYVGAAIVTLPVVLVGYAQWGAVSDFYWLIGWYLLLQFIDGNVLVPVLFSEAVNLHPLSIIIAILVFGGLWGIWGVFFAIPMATLVKSIIKSWPVTELSQ